MRAKYLRTMGAVEAHTEGLEAPEAINALQDLIQASWDAIAVLEQDDLARARLTELAGLTPDAKTREAILKCV